MSHSKTKAIYDALDNFQYKAALNQCNKLLKKKKQYTDDSAALIQSLKCLTLSRMYGGNYQKEALDLTIKTLEEFPNVAYSNDAILQPLVLTLKSQSNHDMVIKLYENAIERRGNDEELYNHLFMAYVRKHDYKKQQQLASRMQKLFSTKRNSNGKSNRYLFWNIMSLLNQAVHCEDDTQQRDFSLLLADKMLKKCIEDNRINDTEELLLYIKVLKTQGKLKEALEAFDLPIAKNLKILESEKLKMQISLMKDLSMWQDICDVCRKFLQTEEREDDYDIWKCWVETLHRLSSDELKENSKIFESFLDKIMSKFEKNNVEKKRGPYIANMYWLVYPTVDKCSIENQKKLGELIFKYYEKFSIKKCCFDDIVGFLGFINEEEAKISLVEHLQTIKKDSLPQVSDIDCKRDNCVIQVNIMKLKAYIGLFNPRNDEDMWNLVFDMVSKYKDALSLGVGLEKTELQYGDDYLLVACHLLLSNISKLPTTSLMDRYRVIIVLLEKGLISSKYNHQFKLLLIRAYLNIGVNSRAKEIYQSLDIKYVLHDSVGHYFAPYGRSLLDIDGAWKVLSDGRSISLNNLQETPEMICQAYKNSTFSKILEFIDFGKRIQFSVQQIHLGSELLRFSLISYLHQGLSLDQIETKILSSDYLHFNNQHFDKTVDNRDREIMASWLPSSQLEVERQTRPAFHAESMSAIKFQVLFMYLISYVNNHKVLPKEFSVKLLNLYEESSAEMSDIQISTVRLLALLADNKAQVSYLESLYNDIPLNSLFENITIYLTRITVSDEFPCFEKICHSSQIVETVILAAILSRNMNYNKKSEVIESMKTLKNKIINYAESVIKKCKESNHSQLLRNNFPQFKLLLEKLGEEEMTNLCESIGKSLSTYWIYAHRMLIETAESLNEKFFDDISK